MSCRHIISQNGHQDGAVTFSHLLPPPRERVGVRGFLSLNRPHPSLLPEGEGRQKRVRQSISVPVRRRPNLSWFAFRRRFRCNGQRAVVCVNVASFNILQDFAHLFDGGLHFHDAMGDRYVIGFRANCVDLAKHFLTEKLQLAPGGHLVAQEHVELLQV